MSFIYFAYGSNMLPARLQARCSTAQIIGTAHAQSHGLQFTKPSKDGSGKATLIETGSQSVATPGVLFEIDRTQLQNLDRAEGAGFGYDRDDHFEVTCARTQQTIIATSYLATNTNPGLKPYDWYLALVLAGSHHHEFHDDHLNALRAVAHVIDNDHGRKGRIDALEALARHGYDDHHTLLRPTEESL